MSESNAQTEPQAAMNPIDAALNLSGEMNKVHAVASLLRGSNKLDGIDIPPEVAYGVELIAEISERAVKGICDRL